MVFLGGAIQRAATLFSWIFSTFFTFQIQAELVWFTALTFARDVCKYIAPNELCHLYLALLLLFYTHTYLTSVCICSDGWMAAFCRQYSIFAIFCCSHTHSFFDMSLFTHTHTNTNICICISGEPTNTVTPVTHIGRVRSARVLRACSCVCVSLVEVKVLRCEVFGFYTQNQ